MCSGSSSGMTGSGCCQICATCAQTAQQTETRIFASTARLRESQWTLQHSPYGQGLQRYNIRGSNVMGNTTYSAQVMIADVCRKYRQLESTRLAALREGAAAEYTKVRAQQDVLADLLDRWNVSIEDAGIDYNALDL